MFESKKSSSYSGFIKCVIFDKIQQHVLCEKKNNHYEITWINSISADEMKEFLESVEIPAKFKEQVKPYVYIRHKI